MALALSGCGFGMTQQGRPIAGQVQMVEVGGQSYALRLLPDLAKGGRQVRLVADSAESAKRVFSEICDGRAYAASDWPEGRLLRDAATGEWAIRGDCPYLTAS